MTIHEAAMLAITVEFDIVEEHFESFLALMRENARASHSLEASCRQFDVCIDPERPNTVFLYELYNDRAAFEAHLASSHFQRFDVAVRGMVVAKRIRSLQRIEPA